MDSESQLPLALLFMPLVGFLAGIFNYLDPQAARLVVLCCTYFGLAHFAGGSAFVHGIVCITASCNCKLLTALYPIRLNQFSL